MKKEDEIIEAFMKLADQHPVEEGHESRFERKLNDSRTVQIGSEYRRFWRYAAAAVFVFACAGLWWRNNHMNEVADNQNVLAYPMEVIKAKAFYTSNADMKSTTIDLQDETVNGFLRKLKLLEGEYNRLDSLYQYNQSNEQLIRGMIENFQFRLQIIHQLKTYIEIKNQSNQEKNENAIG